MVLALAYLGEQVRNHAWLKVVVYHKHVGVHRVVGRVGAHQAGVYRILAEVCHTLGEIYHGLQAEQVEAPILLKVPLMTVLTMIF